MNTRAIWAASLLLAAGCGEDEAYREPLNPLAVEELMKPETCQECHPKHYEEWSGSMHAYAAIDPVFLAMNARGQEETQGKLGDFCVNCHAPMAVRTGATRNADFDLQNLSSELSGVTCYFCHNVASVDGTHNAQLTLAMDQQMRGGIRNPTPNRAHRSAYSPLVDSENISESSSMCGACHDIVTSTDFAPAAVKLERTFEEWTESQFNPIHRGVAPLGCASAGCHMGREPGGTVAVAPGVGVRTRHEHGFPAVDVALTDFPQREAQLAEVQKFLDTSLRYELCVASAGNSSFVHLSIENTIAGHAFPSGAAQDRRLWVEVVATRADLEFTAGVVPDGVAATAVEAADPENFWLMRDVVYDRDGHETHMFWNVADKPKPIDKRTIPLPPPLRPNQNAGKTVEKLYTVRTSDGRPFIPEKVAIRVRMQPIGLDVIDDLIASKYDPGVRDVMPTFDLLPLRSYMDEPENAHWPPHLTIEWTRPRALQNPSVGFPKPLSTPSGTLPGECVSNAPPQ